MRRKKKLSDHISDQYTFAGKNLVKVKVMGFYDTLYPQNTKAQAQHGYILGLLQPPFTFAKIATWVIGLGLISSGTFATVAPESFSQTTSLVETTVDSAIEKTLQVRVDDSFKNNNSLNVEDEEKLQKEELKRLIKEIKKSRGDSVNDKIIDDIVEYRTLKRDLQELKDKDDNEDNTDADADTDTDADERKDKRRNNRKQRLESRQERIEDILQGIKLRGDGSIDDNGNDDNGNDASDVPDTSRDDGVTLRGEGSIDDTSSDDRDDAGTDEKKDTPEGREIRGDGSIDDNGIDSSNDTSDDDNNEDSRKGRGGDRK